MEVHKKLDTLSLYILMPGFWKMGISLCLIATTNKIMLISIEATEPNGRLLLVAYVMQNSLLGVCGQ